MAQFKLFLPILQAVEGGYQNFSADNGNYNSLHQQVGTNFGISARFYEGVLGRPPSVADMKAITKDRAQQMFKQYFWDQIQGDDLDNQSVANIIGDHDVNGGESSIAKIVQRILVNNFNLDIAIDGDIGPQTAAAINSVDQQQLFDYIKAGRESFYDDLGGQFLNTWLKRLKSFSFSDLSEKKKQALA